MYVHACHPFFFLFNALEFLVYRDRGYGDFAMVPDVSTLRVASWLDKTAHVICNVIDPKTRKPVSVAPRSILLGQVDKAHQLGYQGVGASELEYFMYKDSYEEAHKKGYKGLDHFGYYLGDYHMLQSTREEKLNAVMRRELKKSGVPIENSKGEYGFGQHELNIRYADVLTMSDRHMVYKTCFKEVAQKLGMAVTFMAKPHASQSGSSCHLHVNLSDLDGNNLFHGNDDLEGIKCSEIFRHFLGGWIRNTPDLIPFYAPTINSYKRFAAASWAPTRLAWSVDNRTAGFRIVGEGKALRIEFRLPGADANPYLAFAAALASGLDGVLNKIEPTLAGAGNFYLDKTSAPLPSSLQEATLRFKNSDFARKTFGDDVVDHYAHFYQTECDSFDKAVTDWERARYFEQV
jgi:glutamine synthetase